MSANLTINKKAEGGNEEQADGMCKFSSPDLENRKGVLMQTLQHQNMLLARFPTGHHPYQRKR